MSPGVRDVAQIRLDNAMLLFEEFVQATVKHPDAATLRGLERRFAERLQIQPSYWSQIKGEHLELARQAFADLARAALDLAPVARLDLQSLGEAALEAAQRGGIGMLHRRLHELLEQQHGVVEADLGDVAHTGTHARMIKAR